MSTGKVCSVYRSYKAIRNRYKKSYVGDLDNKYYAEDDKSYCKYYLVTHI